MSQVTTGELSGMVTLVCGGGFTILGYFVKKWIDGIDKKIDKFSETQNACQLTLPEKYVLKKDCDNINAKIEHNILELAGKKSNGKGLSYDTGH